MPHAQAREVTLHRSGTLEGDPLPDAVLEHLRTWAKTGVRWDARCRTSLIAAGLPQELLRTEEDVLALPVPERTRLRLGLLSGPAPWLERELEQNPEMFFEEDGQRKRQLSVRRTEYELDGRWVVLPELDPDEALRYLTQHPALGVRPPGDDHTVTVWRGGERDGEVEIEPEPEARYREALSEAARSYLGNADEDWQSDHQVALMGQGSADTEAAPLARRTTLRLSSVALALSPAFQLLDQSTDLDIYVAPGVDAYSQGGQDWQEYPQIQANSDRLQALLEGMGIDNIGELAALLGQGAEGGPGQEDDGRTIDAEVVGNGAAESSAEAGSQTI